MCWTITDRANGGSARRWWLHHSLEKLEKSLEDKGLKLVLRSGPAAKVLRELFDGVGEPGVMAPASDEAGLDERIRR